jgi:hypothetical protein
MTRSLSPTRFTTKATGAYQKTVRGKPISQKKIHDINDLFWEQKESESAILKIVKCSSTVFDRALFHTRAEWEEFKRNCSF